MSNTVAAFQQGLNEVGYVEGRNAAIEYRWAGDRVTCPHRQLVVLLDREAGSNAT
jgi:hypothetical protein